MKKFVTLAVFAAVALFATGCSCWSGCGDCGCKCEEESCCSTSNPGTPKA